MKEAIWGKREAQYSVRRNIQARRRRNRAYGQKAVKRSLIGQPLLHVGPGQYRCPVLGSQSDGLPFTMSIDLFACDASVPTSQMTAKPEKGLFSLHYIMVGDGQLMRRSGRSELVRPGDSVLAPHGHTSLRPVSSSPVTSTGWQMASMSLLLSRDLDPQSQEPSARQDHEACDASSYERRLTEQEVQWIITGAKSTAQDSDGRQDPFAVSLLPHAHVEDLDRFDADIQAQSSDLQSAMQSRTGEEGSQSSGIHGQNADTAHEEPSNMSLPGQVPIDAAWSTALTTLGGLAQALRQLSRWRRRGSLSRAVLKKSVAELNSFRLPHQTNRLALVFDPLGDSVNFTFGVEIFEREHKTTPHIHHLAHELFFILAGKGEGFCDAERFQVSAGDVIVFPPGSRHGIDVNDSAKMYCLEVMQPNDMFAELVRAGMPAGCLQDDDLCILIASGCA